MFVRAVIKYYECLYNYAMDQVFNGSVSDELSVNPVQCRVQNNSCSLLMVSIVVVVSITVPHITAVLA